MGAFTALPNSNGIHEINEVCCNAAERPLVECCYNISFRSNNHLKHTLKTSHLAFDHSKNSLLKNSNKKQTKNPQLTSTFQVFLYEQR